MNSEDLWETTLNPENRRLIQITIEDDIEVEDVISICMGDSVEPRRQFIECNALSADKDSLKN